jgi:glucosamine--fructose-6-phosphate aminotransferase (isomerizing)
VDPTAFLTDLEAGPAALRALARSLATHDPWDALPSEISDVVLLGLGSSRYAAGAVADRLQADGVRAVAALASTDLLPRTGPGTVVVAVSATGGSRETLDAVARITASGPVGALVALTNDTGSSLARAADVVVDVAAGVEAGGVACRSYTHCLALLLALRTRLSGGRDLVPLLRSSADAADDLLTRRPQWLPQVSELLDGPDGTHVAAPAHRFTSAQQSALMLREGPRRVSTGCETGDWSHVDVYLTRTTDYRLLLLAGSRWEAELLDWCTRRGSTVVSVGADGAAPVAATLRYRGDADDDVRLLTETLVAELVAARLWLG